MSNRPSFDVGAEKAGVAAFEGTTLPVDASDLKVDKHGLPYVPQPSRWRDDPLNWPTWLKWAVLIHVSFAAFLGPFNCAVINPSLVVLAKAFDISTVEAAYNSTTAIIFGGVFAFIWMPLSNVYGRRPVLLLSLALTTVGAVGSAVAPTFNVLLGTRVINGVGISCLMSLGTAVVNDIFFLHERGFKTGIYTVFITNGAHVAVLFGGFLAQAVGWRWDYWLPAILDAALLVSAVFLVPETLFSRNPEFLATRIHERSYTQMLFNLKGNLIPGRRFSPKSFLHPILMLKYPSVAFPAFYYCLGWTFINTLPAVTIANTYNHFYKFNSGKIGLCLGVALIIGSFTAEAMTGRVTDFILYNDSKKNNGVRRPEARLYLTAIGAVAQPVGLITYGFCLQNNKSWICPLIGLSIGAFGLQMTSTCLYAYVSDCYKPQTMESSVLFNLGRGLAFVVGYFAIPFADASGYGWAWFTFAMIMIVGYIPLGLLIFKGEKWRARLGEPAFDRYI